MFCAGAIALGGGLFGRSDVAVLIEFNCTGEETSVDKCISNNSTDTGCDNAVAACQGVCREKLQIHTSNTIM